MARSNLFAILLLTFIAWNYRQQIKSLITPVSVPQSLMSQGSCQSKKNCAVVYLAPWCPACKQIEPMLKEIYPRLKEHPNSGLLVIMGGEMNAGENETAARAIHNDVVIDQNRSIAQSLKVSYFPTILVLDDKRKVIKKDQAALSWIIEQSK